MPDYVPTRQRRDVRSKKSCALPKDASRFCPISPTSRSARRCSTASDNGWAVNIEFTDDPHPRNTYWEMWGLPMFDLRDAAGVMMELNECRKVYGDRYIRLSAFDSSHGWESVRLSFIVNRPKDEPGFRLERHEVAGRNIRYTTTVLRRRSSRGPALRLATDSVRQTSSPSCRACRMHCPSL